MINLKTTKSFQRKLSLIMMNYIDFFKIFYKKHLNDIYFDFSIFN